MPKKFATENPKVTAARERKADAKKVETDRKQKAADDAYWADDDKLASRKLQRKDDADAKRVEALKRKEENRKLAEEESTKLGGKTAVQKVTRHDLDKQREAALLVKLQEERKKQEETKKIEVVEHLEENINKLDIETESARTVDQAITALGGEDEDFDKHPEKRMRAAYMAFEEKRLPQLKTEHPTFRLSQLKQIMKKEWIKSPENPLNQRLMGNLVICRPRMVLIFHDGGQPVKMALDELKNKTPAQIIQEIMKNPVDTTTYLTRMGRKYPSDELLSSSAIHDEDFLRIVTMEASNSTTVQSEEDVDKLRKQCMQQYKAITRDPHRVLYYNMLTRMIDDDFFRQQLQDFPELEHNVEAKSYVAEPMMLPNIFRDTANMRQLCHENPVLLKVMKKLMDDTTKTSSLGNIPSMFLPAQPQRPPQQQQQVVQPLTAEFLQQSINFALGNVVPAQQAPQAVAQPNDPFAEARQRYAAELQQMAECGFPDEEINLTVLMQVDGNVATAMEILIEDANP